MKDGEIEDVIKSFKTTIGKLKLQKPEIVDPFLTLVRNAGKKGALAVKQKELINLGISVCTKCKHCIVLHTRSALEAGATKEELIETCGLALMMGGTSTIGYISMVLDCIEKFSK